MRPFTFRARTGLLAAFAFAFAFAGTAGAQQPQPAPAPAPAPAVPAADGETPRRYFQVTRTTSPIRIDGVLDEEGWQSATVVDLPYEWFPGDNGTPPVQTDGAGHLRRRQPVHRLQGPGSQSQGHPRQPDGPRPDRHLRPGRLRRLHRSTPFNDERQGFQFRVNPRGVQVGRRLQRDRMAARTSPGTRSGPPAGRSPTTATWSRSPCPSARSASRAPRRSADLGHRVLPQLSRNVRHRISSRFTNRSRDCTLCEENKITGFQGIAPGRNLEVTPTVTARASMRRRVPARRARGGRRGVRARHHRALGRHPQRHAQRHHQSRLLPGRSRRAAARRQHPLRPVLPGEAPVLPRRGRSLPHPPGRGLHPHGRRARLGRQAQRQGGQERLRHVRGPGRHQQPPHPWQPGIAPRLPRPEGGRGRDALPARRRRALVHRRALHRARGRRLPQPRGRPGRPPPLHQVRHPARPVPALRHPISGSPGHASSARAPTRSPAAASRPSTTTSPSCGGPSCATRISIPASAPTAASSRGSTSRPAKGSTSGSSTAPRRPGTPRRALGFHGLRTEDHEGILTDQVAEVFGRLNGPRQSNYELRLQKNKEFYQRHHLRPRPAGLQLRHQPFGPDTLRSSSPGPATRSTSVRRASAGRSSSTPPSSSGWAAA